MSTWEVNYPPRVLAPPPEVQYQLAGFISLIWKGAKAGYWLAQLSHVTVVQYRPLVPGTHGRDVPTATRSPRRQTVSSSSPPVLLVSQAVRQADSPLTGTSEFGIY
ncbi:unnamed protein product [Calypogeia fissa]